MNCFPRVPPSYVRSLFHNNGSIEFWFSKTIVRIAFSPFLQAVSRNAVLVCQQVVNVLHTLFRETLIELLASGSFIG